MRRFLLAVTILFAALTSWPEFSPWRVAN